jgi:hypothetical protein
MFALGKNGVPSHDGCFDIMLLQHPISDVCLLMVSGQQYIPSR